jgi:hypothetical protein
VKKLPFKKIVNLIIGTSINCLHCGLIIGAVLTYIYFDGGNQFFFFITQFLGVFIGEVIILTLGIILFEIMFKNKDFKRIMDVE